MNCLIGLGSNLGDRLMNLEVGARSLAKLGALRVSPVFETPAVVPEGAPPQWRLPFLNAVAEVDTDLSALDLLKALKTAERKAGRAPGEAWAPRVLDLDLLTYGDQRIESESLNVPHPRMNERAFVLEPLKHLRFAKAPRRPLTPKLPAWMGILNLTPDSFSDGGDLGEFETFTGRCVEFEKAFVQYLDLGAESTRPGAEPLTPELEWSRLERPLEWLADRYRDRWMRPRISVDTRHSATAARALEYGVDMINDVSGLSDPEMVEIVRSSRCEYVLMHSLSVPADPALQMQGSDVVADLKRWVQSRLDALDRGGVDLNRIVFDPGLGFGKSAAQSLELVRRAGEFLDLPVRVLWGHSRKSFLKHWGDRPPREREPESLAVSLALAARGADILRVHEPAVHARAWTSLQEIGAC